MNTAPRTVVKDVPAGNGRRRSRFAGTLLLLLLAVLALLAADAVYGASADLTVEVVRVDNDPADINDTFTVRIRPVNFGPGVSGSGFYFARLVSPAATAEVISVTNSPGQTCSHTTGNSSQAFCFHSGLPVSSHATLDDVYLEFTVRTGVVEGPVRINLRITNDDGDPVPDNDRPHFFVDIDNRADTDVCYAVDEEGTENLVRFNRDGSGVSVIGPTGAVNMESIAFGPLAEGQPLYAFSNDQFGELNINTGAFVTIGSPVGSLLVDTDQDGEVESTRNPNDVDGLTVHPHTGVMWATERETTEDFIFAVNQATGAAIPNAFGNDTSGDPIGGLVIDFTGCPDPTVDDLDDIAIHNDGRWFIILSEGAMGDSAQMAQLTLGPDGLPDGGVAQCGLVYDICGDVVEDMEGLSFDEDGRMWGTTGFDGNASQTPACGNNTNNNRAWTFDLDAGIQSNIGGSGNTGWVVTREANLVSVGQDYEGSDCRTTAANGVNTIAGRVWFDLDQDSLNHDIDEGGFDGITVNLYYDANGNGIIDAADRIVQTTETDINGDYQFTVAPGGSYLLQVDTNDLPNGAGGAMPFLTTDNIERAVFSPVGGGNQELRNDFGFAVNATAAVIREVSSRLVDGQAVITFDTAVEAGSAYFTLYRHDPDENTWRVVNRRPITALPGDLLGGRYQVVDAGVSAGERHRYALVETEVDGTRRRYGPYRVVIGAGPSVGAPSRDQASRTVRRALGSDGFDRQAHRAGVESRDRARSSQRIRQRDLLGRGQGGRASRRAFPRDNAFHITVDRDGLHHVDAAHIAAQLGLATRQVQRMIDGQQLSLDSGGARVHYLPARRGGLYFYGTALRGNPYTVENVYWLRTGQGRHMEVNKRQGRHRDVPGGGASRHRSTTQEAWFTDTVVVESNKLAMTTLETDPEADIWFWQVLVGGVSSFDTVVSTPGIVDGGDGARLRVHVKGATDFAEVEDHRFAATVNGVDVGVSGFDGIGRQAVAFDLPPGLLREGGNTVALRALAIEGGARPVSWLDRLEVDYPRAFRAHDNHLRLPGGTTGEVTVTGFGERRISVFDITEPNRPVLLAGLAIDGQDDAWQVRFQVRRDHHYLALTADGAQRPATVELDQPDSLRRIQGADYLVIAPAALHDGAEALAALRDDRFVTRVVALQDIYDAFHHGIRHPRAIRDFLRHAVSNWSRPPRHVVLAGKGTLDHRDALGLGTNLLPLWLTSTPHGLFAADTLIFDLVGDDGVPDVSFGRIPVVDNDGLLAYVDKLARFERDHVPGRHALLVADDPDMGGDFHAASNDIAAILANYPVETVHVADASSTANHRADLHRSLGNGPWLLNYVGHGAVTAIGSPALLENDDVPTLANGSALPVLLALTCAVGNSSYPGFDSLSETLLLHASGGVVAAVAPTGLSYTQPAHALNRLLVDAFADPAGTGSIGEATAGALAAWPLSGSLQYLRRIYGVIGDPAVRVGP